MTQTMNLSGHLAPSQRDLFRLLCGLTSLIGLGGLLGALFRIVWLRSYIPGVSPEMSWPVAVGLILLGLALWMTFEEDRFSSWKRSVFQSVRYSSILLPGVIGLYYVIRYFTEKPGENFLTPFYQFSPQIGASFLSGLNLLLFAIALGAFLLQRKSENAAAYSVGILALIGGILVWQ
jgi:hypothetical protein